MKKVFIGIVVCIILIFQVFPTIFAIESKKNDGEVDLIGRGNAWWSPAPWDNGDILGFFLTIENIGDSYQRENIKIFYSVYIIYPDYEEIFRENQSIITKSYIDVGEIWGLYDTPILNEKPEKIRLEIETNVPESNKLNNNITLEVKYGVTFYGMVYRNIFGNKYPVWGGIVSCNTDIPSLPIIDTGIYRNGSYLISVPKNSTLPPYSYTLHVSLGFGVLQRVRVKETLPLDEFEYAEIDFNFGIRDKAINPLERLIDRVVTIFPILRNLIVI